ncbi:phage protein [Yersinia intermedia]|nr:phage protein [Yersinia intermedia]
MANGTVAVTNGSDVLLGTGTTFTTDVIIGDLLTFKIQEVVYTVTVISIVSNTEIKMIRNFDGPTMAGLPWRPFPAQMIMEISAQLNIDVQYLMRGFILDKQNWQQLLTVDADVTVRLPDGSSYTGIARPMIPLPSAGGLPAGNVQSGNYRAWYRSAMRMSGSSITAGAGAYVNSSNTIDAPSGICPIRLPVLDANSYF